MKKYLDSSEHIDWKHPLVAEKAAELAEGCLSDEDIAKRCFEFVRDAIKHSWDYRMNPVTCKASDVLIHSTGYCYAKSHLLAALLRANAIPAGLCYQRLAIEADGPPYCLHGLNAIYLEQYGWYRVDARGNKPGVAAEFSPPSEYLAFPVIGAAEKDFPEICAEPLAVVVQALTRNTTVEQVFENLPDIEIMPRQPQVRAIRMEYESNHLNQPVGLVVGSWQSPPHPAHEPMEGRFCRLEPLDPVRHAPGLYAANALDVEGRNWTYLPYGPFDSPEGYRAWMEQQCCGSDPLFYAIVDLANGKALGVASYLRITPASGSIEVGHLNYSPPLQRTPAATEAMYLMMARAFELGYRRYEWKCNALNAPSRAAAQRLGLSFEGVFRQATIIKGRNRDTAWYAAIDQEWLALREAFLQWLDPANFDERGKQRSALSDLTAPILKQRG